MSKSDAGGRVEMEAFDGRVTRAFFPGSHEGRIEKALPELPSVHTAPLPWLLMVFGEPLSAWLDSGVVPIQGAEPCETECVVLQGRGPGNAGFRVHLDPARDFVLLKVEEYRTGASEELTRVLEFKDYQRKEGVWFPARIEEQSFRGGRPSSLSVVIVESLEVNEAMSDSRFYIDFPPGTKIDDLR
jgi:hypothetical protein